MSNKTYTHHSHRAESYRIVLLRVEAAESDLIEMSTETLAGGTPPRRQRLLILVGIIGSGKTTLAEAMIKTGQWVRASQDDAPTRRRQECEAMVRQGLQSGKDVVVDRVDFDPQ